MGETSDAAGPAQIDSTHLFRPRRLAGRRPCGGLRRLPPQRRRARRPSAETARARHRRRRAGGRPSPGLPRCRRRFPAGDARAFFEAAFRPLRGRAAAGPGLLHRLLRAGGGGLADADGRVHGAAAGAGPTTSSSSTRPSRPPGSTRRSASPAGPRTASANMPTARRSRPARSPAAGWNWSGSPTRSTPSSSISRGRRASALADGGTMRVTYAAKTGHPYTPIGRVLVERGALAARQRHHAGDPRLARRASGDEAAAMMAANRSYIFFREAAVDDPGAGAGGGGEGAADARPEPRRRPTRCTASTCRCGSRRPCPTGRSVQPAHDRPGHRLGDRRPGARRHLLRLGRRRRRASPGPCSAGGRFIVLEPPRRRPMSRRKPPPSEEEHGAVAARSRARSTPLKRRKPAEAKPADERPTRRGSPTSPPPHHAPAAPRAQAEAAEAAGAGARSTGGRSAASTAARSSIDARIDLHGMTQAAAHGRLIDFLRGAQASGARLVLVITGKGKTGNGEEARGRAAPPGADLAGLPRAPAGGRRLRRGRPRPWRRRGASGAPAPAHSATLAERG